MRSPLAGLDIASSIIFTAKSASFATSWKTHSQPGDQLDLVMLSLGC